MDIEVDASIEVSVDRVAKGGAALGLGPDGRVVFVDRAIPGERVKATVTATHRRRLEARTVDVIEASPHRRKPPCPMVEVGCGGCDWQHIEPAHQAALRAEIVSDALRRLGGLDDIEVRQGPALEPEGYRTTVRAAVVNGRAAYRRRSSHDLVAIDTCLIAHPSAEELLIEGRFGSASEVVVRVGARTGERMVMVDTEPSDISVPDDVVVATTDSPAGEPDQDDRHLDHGEHGHHHDHGQHSDHDHGHHDHGHDHDHTRPHIHETIAGLRLQISAGSFFQCRPDGAEALATIAADAVADAPGTLLDAYGGVGLFGAVAGTGRRIIGVESNPIAAHDAAHNYGPQAEVVTQRFERWQPRPVGVAIADPARAGLKSPGCRTLAATGAELIALVSCDPASLARDAALLVELGYELDWVTVVDLFGQTSHVETVSRFRRR